MRQLLSLVIVVVLAFVTGCASMVVPGDAGDGGPRSDTGRGCALPGGGTCAFGTSCPAPDGCNTCTCSASGGLSCTERACAQTCNTTVDCPPGQECTGGAGCDAQWTCQHTLCASTPATWCGCDGQTFTTMNACPSRHYVHEGPCEMPIPDAGPTCAPQGSACNTGGDCCSGYCMQHGSPISTCETPPAGMFGCGLMLCNAATEYCELTFSDVPTPDSAVCHSRDMCTGIPVSCTCVTQHPCGGCSVIDANTVSFRCPGG